MNDIFNLLKGLEKISCICKDKIERSFEVIFQIEGKEYCFQVYTIPRPLSGEFFEMNLKMIDVNTLKIIMMNHHNIPEYESMGIPDALIPFISTKLSKRVVSSSNKDVPSDEYSLDNARKVWKRLEANGLSFYNSEEDMYVCKP